MLSASCAFTSPSRVQGFSSQPPERLAQATATTPCLQLSAHKVETTLPGARSLWDSRYRRLVMWDRQLDPVH